MQPRDLSTIPKDLVRLLFNHYLDKSSIFNLSNTSRYFREIAQQDPRAKQIYLDQINEQSRLNDSHRKLLSHAALGEWDQAEIIWLEDPCLLTYRGTIYHPNRDYLSGLEPINIPVED